MSLRIIFMGTPDFSATVLKSLLGSSHEVVCVYTQPPRPAGRRGLDLVKSAVQQLAEQHQIPVRTPTSLKDPEEQAALADLQADIAVVVAYGLLLPQPILDAPRMGCLNIHASLLPRWRGAAPIQRAIMAGDKETGVMIMKMEAGLDTGPIGLAAKIAISENMTAGQLHDQLAELSGPLLLQALEELEGGELSFTPQETEGAVYAKKIDKAETRIDWSKPAREVHNHIRGISPFPGAWCELPLRGNLSRVKILESQITNLPGKPGEILNENLEIACGTNSLRVTRLQKAGSKPMDAETFCSGNPVLVGTVLQ